MRPGEGVSAATDTMSEVSEGTTDVSVSGRYSEELHDFAQRLGLANGDLLSHERFRVDRPRLEAMLTVQDDTVEPADIFFQRGDDALILPPESTSMEKLSKFRSEISSRREKYTKQNQSTSNNQSLKIQPNGGAERQSTPQPEAAASCAPTSTAGIANSSSEQFLTSLRHRSNHVLQYEAEATRRKVLSSVPLTDINERVQTRMRQLQTQALNDGQPINEASLQETIFFTELMAWFKNQFFEWVNSPACTNCSGDTQFLEMSSSPTEGDRVEVYKCVKCATRVLFPRINDVAKLFDTRKGRCGEWANAFTALCCALGWDARYVLDVTDHVWTEVYFKSEKRWVHLDVCECAIDKPLLYEKGWGKKLSYVIGFSCQDVQDVTWRYSANHSAVLARRRNCSEPQLVKTIRDLNNLRQGNLSAARRKELARRSIAELVELMVPPKESVGDEQGRQSGSLAWRLARSEISMAQAETPAYVWTPTPQEIEGGKIVISYCAATDEYSRGIGQETGKGWRSRVFSAENMFRKEERDWKTVYLCRTEGSAEGKVSWKVDLSGTGLQVDHVEARCSSDTFNNGKVLWLLCSGDKCVPVNGELKTAELRGCSSVTLSASLSGGQGDLAWQHAQLFRQPLNASHDALYLCLTLSKLK